MKNTIYKQANLTRMFFTLFFGLTSVLSFGQAPDGPPAEVPVDGNIIVMLGIAILFAAFFFIRNYKMITNQKLNILKKTTTIKTLVIAAFLMVSASGISQTATWGNVYVHDNGQMHVFTTDYNFMTQAAGGTKTSRTASTYGKISFADAVVVNTTNFGTATDKFIDGYFRKYGTAAIVMPIGQTTTYAPAKVVPTTVDGVDGAYYRANPTTGVGSTIDSGISAISTLEYWHILRAAGSSSNAKISLSWRSTSNIAILTTSSITDLTIVGWNGSMWKAIPSVFDSTNVTDVAGSDSATSSATSLTEGSITSISNIDLSTYQYFTLAAKSACMPLVASSGNTKTWNGTTWSPSAPSILDPAIINGAYSGNLSCNSLVLNADMTLADGELLEVVNGVTGASKVIMSSEASVVQRANGAAAPNIELTKKSRSVMHFKDYIYWGTPISGNFFSQITSNTWNNNLTGTTGSFDLAYKYTIGAGWTPVVPGFNPNTSPSYTGSLIPFTIVTGKGFITRIKNNAPWAAGNLTDTGMVNFKFVGTANNGTLADNGVLVPVTVSATKGYELLANPYPSGVDAQKFLVGNTNLDGNIYLWTSKTPITAGAYTGADYAQWNLAGAINTSPIGLKPDGHIASGQGFRVKANSGSTVLWTNCMRILTGNNNFFRSANRTTSNVDRFNLNVQDNNDKGIYNQILVAYLPDATNDFDRLYDGEKYSTSPTQLYTLLDGQKLGINGRSSFVDSDVVPMGLSNTSTEQSFTISIESKEGIFENDVNVFIHDKANNIYHDMSAPFVFNTNNQAAINDRFEIVYQRNASSTDYLANEVVLNIKDNMLTAKAFEVGMVEITIFDITGRKVQTIDAKNSKSVENKFLHSEGIYVAKVTLANGSVSTQKLVNKK